MYKEIIELHDIGLSRLRVRVVRTPKGNLRYVQLEDSSEDEWRQTREAFTIAWDPGRDCRQVKRRLKEVIKTLQEVT